MTDANGTFVLDEGAAGTLFIRASGYERLVIFPEGRAEFSITPGQLRIPLERGGIISGTYQAAAKGLLLLHEQEDGGAAVQWRRAVQYHRHSVHRELSKELERCLCVWGG